MRPYAAATARNAEPILGVLRTEFAECSSVLEIGSGTGQHAVSFAAELAGLCWQPSELEQNLPGIRAWLAKAELPNVRDPVVLDVLTASPGQGTHDAVFSANTAHIMSMDGVEKMFALVATVLDARGRFCLYGPFRSGGAFNTESNAVFHRTLHDRDPAMGIRNLEDLDRLAASGGMLRKRLYAMPANNHLAVWEKQDEVNP